MTFSEKPVLFSCEGETMLGIVSAPQNSAATGVLIVVGGPQYRIGSHRQFLLLARALAAEGYPAMRFDFRGMGDSSGTPRIFDAVDEDISAAVSAFIAACPSLERIVLWGLCDAASASLLYWERSRDARIHGMVLLNPWVRSEATLARTHIKHYYVRRLMQADFWYKILGGRLRIDLAIKAFLTSLRKSRAEGGNASGIGETPFQRCMLRGFSEFSGPILLILSGDDYTAKEFVETTLANPEWQAALGGKNVKVGKVADADHTFSSAEWRATVESSTIHWLCGQCGV